MINEKQIIEYVTELSETELLNLIARALSDMGTKSPVFTRRRILHSRARQIERLVDSANWLSAGQQRRQGYTICDCIECYAR